MPATKSRPSAAIPFFSNTRRCLAYKNLVSLRLTSEIVIRSLFHVHFIAFANLIDVDVDRREKMFCLSFMVWTSISMELEIGLHDSLLCLTLMSLITVGIYKALVCFFDVDTMKMQTQVGPWASGFGPKPS